jgi:hypothetical protein
MTNDVDLAFTRRTGFFDSICSESRFSFSPSMGFSSLFPPSIEPSSSSVLRIFPLNFCVSVCNASTRKP